MTAVLLQTVVSTFILVAGVIEDIRTRKIRNNVALGALAVAFVTVLVMDGFSGLAAGVFGLLTAAGILFPLYLVKILGAGDVKIFAAFGMSSDSSTVLFVAIASLFWAAILGVLQIILKGELGNLIANMKSLLLKREAIEKTKLHQIPYSVALLMGWLTHLTVLQAGGRFM